MGTFEDPFNNFSKAFHLFSINDNISLIINPTNIIDDFYEEIIPPCPFLIKAFDYTNTINKGILMINYKASFRLKNNVTIENLILQFEDLLDIHTFITLEEGIHLVFQVFKKKKNY